MLARNLYTYTLDITEIAYGLEGAWRYMWATDGIKANNREIL